MVKDELFHNEYDVNKTYKTHEGKAGFQCRRRSGLGATKMHSPAMSKAHRQGSLLSLGFSMFELPTLEEGLFPQFIPFEDVLIHSPRDEF